MSDPFAGFDAASAMLDQRRVMISGPLDPMTAGAAATQLMYLDGVSAAPVTVIVNSAGGAVGDALALFDTLRLMRTPLTIDVLGRAEGSAGAFVAGAPGERRLGAMALISLRLPRHCLAAGNADDLGQLAERSEAERRAIAEIIVERTGQSPEWVEAQFDHGVSWRGPEAVEAGLVDTLR